MIIPNEKVKAVKNIDKKYFNMLSNKDKKCLKRFINGTFRLSGHNELLRFTFNLIKVKSKLISIDVIYQILSKDTNKKYFHIKRFYVKK